MSGAEVACGRMLLGRSAELWADDVRIEPGRWSAFSGADTVDYNLVMCAGPDSVRSGLAELKDLGAPGLLMLADVALGEAQILAEASWVCIGSVPFFRAGLRDVKPRQSSPPPGSIRRLEPGELPAARELLVEVFRISPAHSLVAFPDRAVSEPGFELWGAFEGERLVSCLGFCRVEEAVGPWSLASHPAVRGRGHASHLLARSFAAQADAGAEVAYFQAARGAVDLYLDLGFELVERWQLWTRPRWVLANA